MRRSIKITCYAACFILSFLLEGCIGLYTGRTTFIDAGGAIANIGQKQARLRPDGQTEKKGRVISQFRYRIWKKEDSYILQLPVCYVPARYPVLVHLSGSDAWRKKTLEGQYPGSYTDAELRCYPVEYFYAELTEKQYKMMWRVDRRIKQNYSGVFRDVRILPAAEVDLSHAVLLSDGYGEQHPMRRIWRNSENLPSPRRTWYNRCLMPLSWAAEVVDIPLSLIVTPIGWIADAIYEPLNN